MTKLFPDETYAKLGMNEQEKENEKIRELRATLIEILEDRELLRALERAKKEVCLAREGGMRLHLGKGLLFEYHYDNDFYDFNTKGEIVLCDRNPKINLEISGNYWGDKREHSGEKEAAIYLVKKHRIIPAQIRENLKEGVESLLNEK